MRKAVWGSVLTAAVLLLPGSAFAQTTDTKSVTVSATVNAKAKLTLSGTTASFADADPDVTPLLSASAITVSVKSRTSASGVVTLTVLASDDLISGSDVITIDNLTWAATGDLVTGTMDKTTAQSLGSWSGGGTGGGTQTYKLVNSWSYKTGSYSTTITYTLTAP